MKLIEDSFEFTDYGIEIAVKFEKIVKDFLKDYQGLNPIELTHILSQSLEMQMGNYYCETIETFYFDKNK